VTMNLSEDSESSPFVQVSFNGKLQIPERPEMLATLSFENNATHNSIGASYSYDATLINLTALFDSDMNNGDIKITTHTDLSTDIQVRENIAMTGSVTKNGTLIGRLEERFGVPVIKYTDGSFESLP